MRSFYLKDMFLGLSSLFTFPIKRMQHNKKGNYSKVPEIATSKSTFIPLLASRQINYNVIVFLWTTNYMFSFMNFSKASAA